SVLAAAFLRVLSFWSGEKDVITGLVSHGRPETEDGERILGLFLNAVPFRLVLAGGTWSQLVREVLRAEARMLPHRRVPLAELQQRAGGQPLFETAFTYVNFHVLERVTGSSDVQLLGGSAHEETSFTLSVNFNFNAASGRISVGFDYDASLLDPDQVRQIADTCLAALAAMAASPDTRYEEAPLLTAGQRRQLLLASDGGEALQVRACAHRLFERLAQEDPEAAAVVADGVRLTYRDLNQRANQVAHALRMWGVGPETRVALFLDRTPDLAVALLAVWKAGGAYLPLDISYPAERLRFMVEDARAEVLVTTDLLLDRLPAGMDRLSLVRLDFDSWLIDAQSTDDLLDGAGPENLAYVIYTSGSTGRPKGVMVPHGGLGSLAAAQAGLFDVAPGDRVLQFAAFSFDASVAEIVTTLLNGAELHLASGERLLPGPDLARLLAERRITHLTIPPSSLAVLPVTELPDLRTLIVAGEACPPELIGRWSRPGRRLVNAYGPTEATVCSAGAVMDRESGTLPLGRPIPGARTLVLDRSFEPVPVGVPGELALGGVGLARGYQARPDLTAERFVPDPFPVDAAGGRLYRTGDLVRWLPGGQLDFLGRIDQQVKIRGYRIEIGEIEAQLARHPAVREAAVDSRLEGAGPHQLVAYLVLSESDEGRDGHEMDPALLSSLRAHLQDVLPDYMVPAVWMALPALPLNPSGKLDRRALPSPDRLRPALEKPFAAPRNASEETVANIWAEVLSLDRVGIDDNFFEIGGHSLLATQIAARLSEAFGADVTVQSLFDTPTVATLTGAILQKKVEDLDAGLVTGLLEELEQLSDEELKQHLAIPAAVSNAAVSNEEESLHD
ncbi:MAG TPA: amino acid adenylation domain-containing protein, partial [Thermoanaerobaculia bacterium]|nr:amino acid adenylation domain-containing protein [Thermoanaerobaculia bacterium]